MRTRKQIVKGLRELIDIFERAPLRMTPKGSAVKALVPASLVSLVDEAVDLLEQE